MKVLPAVRFRSLGDRGRPAPGFSLTEMLIVLALFAILVLISIPWLYGMLRAYRVENAASGFAVNLRFARNAAVEKRCVYRVSVVENDGTGQANSYTILADTNYDGTPDKLVLERGLSTDKPEPGSPVVFSGNSTISIDFDERGAASVQQTFVIADATSSGKRYQVSVRTNGTVEVVQL